MNSPMLIWNCAMLILSFNYRKYIFLLNYMLKNTTNMACNIFTSACIFLTCIFRALVTALSTPCAVRSEPSSKTYVYPHHYNIFVFYLSSIGSTPVVADCDGHFTFDTRKNHLTWSLPLIDSSNKTGSLEFTAPQSIPNDFFPLHISFNSKCSYAKIKVSEFIIFLRRFIHHNL